MTEPRIAVNHGSELRLVVEWLRLISYAWFWLLVLTGIILTHFFSDLVVEESILVEVFGYNNICVYFDHPPASYVLPFLWSITLTLLLSYIVTHWLHMRAELEKGTLSLRLYNILSRLKAFEAFCLISFSTVFAVNPHHDQSLVIHTVPFFLVQIALVSLAMTNTLHGIYSGYWQRLALPSWFTKAALAYCLVFAVIVAFKIPVTTNALVLAFMTEAELANLGHSLWWEQTDMLNQISMIIDKLFLVFAALIPMLKAAFLLRYRSDKIDTVVIRPSLLSHRTRP